MTVRHAVLIHGAWAGPWVWDTVMGPLRDGGLEPQAIHLPGTGPWPLDATDAVGIDELAAAVLEQVASLEGKLLLVAHSGAGVVATQVAERIPERVAGVVFVAGMMLPSGMNFRQLCHSAGLDDPVGVSRFTRPTVDGRGTVVPPEAAAAVFFQRASAADAVAAARRLVPQLESARLITPTWTEERFGSLPRLYIEATEDRSVPLAAQREMQRLVPGAHVATLETDHAPQLSCPQHLVTAVLDFVQDICENQRD